MSNSNSRRANPSPEEKAIFSSPKGARVFYWTPTGARECGSIVGSNKLADNTIISAVCMDRTGETVFMPTAALEFEQSRK